MIILGLQNKGYNGELVTIQCAMHQGFPSFDITGLGDNVIKESKDRVRSSIRVSGLRFPQETILINLSPPEMKKSGANLDLPIALSILFAKSDINAKILANGELDLNGNILPSPGTENALEKSKIEHCNILVLAKGCVNDYIKQFITQDNPTLHIVEAETLNEAFDEILNTLNAIEEERNGSIQNSENELSFNNSEQDSLGSQEQNIVQSNESPFKGIIGLKTEKEALMISAAGGHSLLFFGAKGVGKSMLLSRYPLLTPPLDYSTKNELSKIRSDFDLFPSDKADCLYLDNNNKSSVFASGEKPQEILLYHGGSVIVDEFTKLDERTLTLLQNIHDTQKFNVSKNITYPLRFNILGSFNPCPCGALGSKRSVCYCPQNRITSHLKNLSTTLLSRFDIVCPITEADFLHEDDSGFEDAIERVRKARIRQALRYQNDTKIRLNSDIAILGSDSNYIQKAYMFFPESENPRDALLHYGIALTLADLDDSDEITPLHIEKAKLLKVTDVRNYFVN